MPVERTERVIAIWLRSTGNGRNPMFNGRRQPSRGGTSRMMREYQVRFCERLGVKFPGPTRHKPNASPALACLLPPPAPDIPMHALSAAMCRFCCKSLFALAIKNSFGRIRDFRIKMWGTSSPEEKLTGDLGNVIEATSIDTCDCTEESLGSLQVATENLFGGSCR